MTTPDLTLGTLPGTTAQDQPQAPVPEPPAAPVTEEGASRRKKAVLLLLFFVLLGLTAFSLWYLLFRKPISEIPLPVAPAAMPTYQGSLYKVSKPQGIAVSLDGSRVYVTQTGTSQDTVMMDLAGNKLAVLQPPTKLIPQAHQLFVAVDPVTNQVWTTDRYNAAVAIYSGDGRFLRIFDQGAERANWQPLGIAFDKAGDAYIADVSNGAAVIDVFGPTGKFVRSFGQDSGLNHPNGIAVTPDGTTYVADTGNGRLVVFDATGKKIGLVPRGVSAGDLGLPVGVAIDDHGRIAVADSTGSAIQEYSPIAAGAASPAYIDAFAEKGTADGQLSFPNGLAADSRGRLFVADWGNDRLEIWSY